MSSVVTAQLFDAYVRCPVKCLRRFKGLPGRGNIYAEWLRAREESYLDAYVKRASQASSPQQRVWDFSGAAMSNERDWRFASGWSVRTNNLESTVQIVERVRSPARGTDHELIPMRFSSANKVDKETRLLVAFDALVISILTRREVRLGKVVHGDEYLLTRVRTDALKSDVRKVIRQIDLLLSRDSPPDLNLSQHCNVCEFQPFCMQDALARDDIGLLPNISRQEIKRLRSLGILTLTHLSHTFRPRRRPKRLSESPPKYYHALKALAIREHKIHVAGRDEFRIDGTPVYLDVEAIPDADFYYLIGLRFCNGSQYVQHSLWADSMADERDIWHRLVEIVSTISRPVLVHFGGFETTFLKRMQRRYGVPSDDSTFRRVISEAVNILSFIHGRVYFPTYTNGLKDIAAHLGFTWTIPGTPGILTIMWRRDWERSRGNDLRHRLIEYNANDCEALDCVADCLSRISARHVEAGPNPDQGFVDADSLPRKGLWKFHRIDFQLKALEEINKTAYWNYQHEKVLLRSSDQRRRASRIPKKKETKIRVDKVVRWPPPSECPGCGCQKLYKYRKDSKTLVDIRFGKTGIKRCVTNFMFHRHLCTGCRATFSNVDPSWSRVRYGQNLMVLAVYLNIDMRLSQSRIAVLINELFKLQLTRNVINRFKARAAAMYAPTYHNLLRMITAGHLIHADETEVNLGSNMGYVWTFTDTERVCYVYSPSREGALVQTILKDFKGVLVSDFYSAYEPLPCPQQKCLIHLIRDLNEDLTKEPFNQELRILASDFAELLRAITLTIDQFGLKTRFLRKHKRHVKRFFRDLSRKQVVTEVAVRWKKRLERNRSKLFTFLDYDDVSWNNNSAEHAIKAIAYLRKDLSGVSTEKGMRDYLIVLSVRETCRFKGVSFLDFLRSGEMDVDAFADKKISHQACPHQRTETVPQPHPLGALICRDMD